MKSVQSSLREWMKRNNNFKDRHEKLKEEILSDPVIQEFLRDHPQLSEQDINRNLMTFYEYKTQSRQCAQCQSYEQCQNIIQGYSPILQMVGNEVHLQYEKCKLRMQAEKDDQRQKLIRSLYMPKDILHASVNDLHTDEDRDEALRELFQFLRESRDGLPARGLYFHGHFGVGKTYLLGVLANKLKEYNHSSMLIYMPEFVREMRDSLSDDTVNEKLNYFKTADVLMLDDIGAETQSAWFRDEILGSILQYRMMEKLPVFFTSNYNLTQLEEHLAKTTRGGVEKVKAGRIMERIKQVSKEVQLFGKNYRRQQD